MGLSFISVEIPAVEIQDVFCFKLLIFVDLTNTSQTPWEKGKGVLVLLA